MVQIFVIVGTFIVAAVLYFLLQSKKNTAYTLPPFAEGGIPIFGHTPVMNKTPQEFFPNAHKKYGGIYRVKLLWRDLVVVSSRAYFSAYFQARETDLSFLDALRQSSILESVWTNSSSLSIAHTGAIKKLVTEKYDEIMLEQAQLAVDGLADEGEIDLKEFSRKLVATIISIFVMGTYTVSEETIQKIMKLELATVNSTQKLFMFGAHFQKFFLASKVRRQRDEVVRELLPVVKGARANPSSVFMKNVETITIDNRPLTDEEVALMINGGYFAGLTTTSILVANMLFLAACFPEEAKKLRDVTVDSELMHGWVWETARVSKGFLGSFRMTAKDGFELGGYMFPAGTLMMADLKSESIVSKEFDTPPFGDFAPSRWLSPISNETKKYGTLNWGSGMHLCPGKVFATAEMRFVAHTVLSSIDFSKPKEQYKMTYGMSNPATPLATDMRAHYKRVK